MSNWRRIRASDVRKLETIIAKLEILEATIAPHASQTLKDYLRDGKTALIRALRETDRGAPK